jgi:hypothetical protein
MSFAMSEMSYVDVTQEGLAYFTYYFSEIPGLCSAILPIITRTGNIVAPLPAGTTRDRALELTTGWSLPLGIEERWLIPHISQSLYGHPKGALIVQDIWADRDMVRSDAPTYFTCLNGESVHYFLGADDVCSRTLKNALNATFGFIVAIFVLPDCSVKVSGRGMYLASADFDQLAHDVTELIVPAYDHDSYLLWRRNGSE